MCKKIMLFMFALLSLPIFVNARSVSSSVYAGNNLNECTSKYQDNSISINKDIYFGHCMEYTCRDSKTKYYTSNGVTCSNGNTNPYVKMEKNGCNNLSCTSSEKNNLIVKYCSVLMYYDCSRKSNGDSFYTTTTTRKTTTRRYNTTTTTTEVIQTTPVVVNTKLSSLSLSSGSIEFNSDVNEYEIEVDSSINSINVNAVPVDASSKVDITGNSNIVNGSVISITVTGSDGSTNQYKIKVNKKEEEIKLSSNAKLKSLIINDYELDFNSNKFDYTLIINDNVSELDMSMEAEEKDAKISDISGNNNLKDGSKIIISVTAPDGVTINKYNINIRVKKKSNFIKILFIIILVLSILAGAYYIYKKFVLSKSGDKYEYE